MKGFRAATELGASKPHGSRMRYIAGCKCFHCRRANSAYELSRRAARAAGDWNGIVPADCARAHLVKLSRAGIGRDAIGAATDIRPRTIDDIRTGAKKNIRARTERKILKVTTDVRADGSLVPSTRVWKLIRELVAEGYTKKALALKLGYKTGVIQFRKGFVKARTEQRVIALHSRLTT